MRENGNENTNTNVNEKTPSMILFDYGGTLLCEPDFNAVRGTAALLDHVTRNPRGLDAVQVATAAQAAFDELSAARQEDVELHEWAMMRLIYESLDIAFDGPLPQMEEIFWTAASPGAVMPGADRLLDCLNARGIRSGVISNIAWSGDALRRRIDRLLPRNRLEFVIASSEYVFRKPSPRLFQLALSKARLSAGEVWFCGDNPRADVEGAAACGMTAVWYDAQQKDPRARELLTEPPRCPHRRVTSWDELTAEFEGGLF